MNPAVLNNSITLTSRTYSNYLAYILSFFAGLLGPLGFAPFHLPGLTILSLASLYFLLNYYSQKKAFLLGFFYGLAYFGLGISWVIISIHDYGNLNYFFSGIATLGFIAYLALFPALVSYLFKHLGCFNQKLKNALLFSVLWCLSEYARSTLLTGFPCLLVGISQIDTPLHYLFPIVGTYGVSLILAFVSTLLVITLREHSIKRYYYLIAFVLIFLVSAFFKLVDWTTIKNEPVSVGVIQANLAMRDKWDDHLFWSLLKYYEKNISDLLDKDLIILPESAIPLPASYLNDYLLKLNDNAQQTDTALILGILQAEDDSESNFYNAIMSLGQAKGVHRKLHLVPFGEYIPQPFVKITQWLGIPPPNIIPGKKNQTSIKVKKQPIASLICYEIAYPSLLRQQMPSAQWIISISDNGWFGHSLASYQLVQMAQVLSLLTGRFQVVANNDGLSSVINNQGEIIESLPPFSSGVLKSVIYPASGATPWVIWGDYPALISCLIILLFLIFLRLNSFQSHSAIAGEHKRGYP